MSRQPSLHHSPNLLRQSVKTFSQEDDLIASNPLFNDQFTSVLKESLARQGVDALYEEINREGPKTSALEDVLAAALHTSKQQYKFMITWRDQLDRTIAAQEKQINRMEFALNKARNDAAYNKALKDMLYAQDSDS